MVPKRYAIKARSTRSDYSALRCVHCQKVIAVRRLGYDMNCPLCGNADWVLARQLSARGNTVQTITLQ